MDFSFTEEQETVGKVARQLFEHRATPEHLTELESGEVRHDASAVERTGFVGPAGHRVARICRRQRRRLPRTRRATRRGRLERRAGAGLRDTRAWRGHHCAAWRLGDSAAISAEGGGRQRDLDRRSRRTGQLRPDRATHHRTRRRRHLDPGRQQGARARSTACRRHRGVGASRRRPGPVRRRHRQPTASTSRRRAPPTASPTPTSDSPAPSDTGSPRPAARSCRFALHQGTRRAVRDAGRRGRTRARSRRFLHQRTRAVRQADRLIPGRAATHGRRVHRRRGHPLDHLARGVADRRGPTRRPRGRHRQVLGGRSRSAGRRVRPAGTRRHRHRRHLPALRYFLWAKQIELALGSAPQQLARLGAAYPEGSK